MIPAAEDADGTVVNRLKRRWNRISRGDRIALLLADAAIVAACLSLFPFSELTRKDWQIELTVCHEDPRFRTERRSRDEHTLACTLALQCTGKL